MPLSQRIQLSRAQKKVHHFAMKRKLLLTNSQLFQKVKVQLLSNLCLTGQNLILYSLNLKRLMTRVLNCLMKNGGGGGGKGGGGGGKKKKKKGGKNNRFKKQFY